MSNQDWKPISTAPENKIIQTKIDDKDGCRNDQKLKRINGFWWLSDGSMYVYYQPTHWKEC